MVIISNLSLFPKLQPASTHYYNMSVQTIHANLEELFEQLNFLTEIKFEYHEKLKIETDSLILDSIRAHILSTMIHIRTVKNQIEELYDLLFKEKFRESISDALNAHCPFSKA